MKLSGECVISSVLSCCSKNLKRRMDQYYNSVLFGKQRKIHPRGKRVSQPKRCEEKRNEAPSSILALLFICVFPPPPEPALCKLG